MHFIFLVITILMVNVSRCEMYHNNQMAINAQSAINLQSVMEEITNSKEIFLKVIPEDESFKKNWAELIECYDFLKQISYYVDTKNTMHIDKILSLNNILMTIHDQLIESISDNNTSNNASIETQKFKLMDLVISANQILNRYRVMNY